MPIGPSFATLRTPFKNSRSPSFPVFDNLDDTLANGTSLDNPDTPDNRVIRYVLATCSGYAYSNARTVAMMMARLGLPKNHCIRVSLFDDAMLIDSNAFLAQSADGRVVILCYRGSSARPTQGLIDVLLDANVAPEFYAFRLPVDSGEVDTPVHSGFYQNVRATRYKVVRKLDQALHGRSIVNGNKMPNQLEALYLTGHSLGGAMAAMMAVMITAEDSYRDLFAKLRAVYTFGQPMLGSREFVGNINQLAHIGDHERRVLCPVVRFIHQRDVVPHLPPTGSGDFTHFGVEFRNMDDSSEWRRSDRDSGPAGPLDLPLVPLDFVVKKLPALRKMPALWNNLIDMIYWPVDFAERRLPRPLRAANISFLNDLPTRPPLIYSLEDHAPYHYIARLAPSGVLSEFGDVR